MTHAAPRTLARQCLYRLCAPLLLGLAPLAWGQALWLDAAGQPSAAAREAAEWLVQADRDGLRPLDYDAPALSQALTQAETAAPAPEDAARLDAALTQAVLRYLRDLRHGRVDAAQINAHYDSAAAPAPDFASMLSDAAANGSAADVRQAATPPWPQYPLLRDALARYRALADQPAWSTQLPALPGNRLAPNQAWTGLPVVAARLASLGDLAADASATPTSDGVDLRDAVKAFQTRHGLRADGVLNKATLDALAVPPAARAQQIELAMERLRLTPLPLASRFLTVNVPEFMLRAYEQNVPENTALHQTLEMKVIVGKALDTRTPLFDEDMRWIEFSPYWNIPPSIARKETVPKLRANAGYLAAQGMEFVTAGGQTSSAVTPEALGAVLAGQWRIRQRPGARNALGHIKFVLPNDQSIYLHDTNARSLFDRSRRDLSHGCVRVQDPVGLAQWVLHDEPEWTEARIRQSMARPRPVTALLIEPVPVLIIYSTAIATPDGRVHFVPDLYGLDERLARALARPTPRPDAVAKSTLQPRVTRPASGAPSLIAAQ